MKLTDFDYNLPRELIAQYPSKIRDESRLLVIHRNTARIEHRVFKDIVGYFSKDDILVLNNTKVVPARIIGKKLTGGKIEALILPSPYATDKREYEVLLRPARGCKVGSKLVFGDGRLKGEISRVKGPMRFLRFDCNGSFEDLLEDLGRMPLPPYIKREPIDSDIERYQTVYASKKGAVAAPTAGLHFTEGILSSISKKGVCIEQVTLHVGYGTFRPVKCEDIKDHSMEREYFEIGHKVAEKVRAGRNRVIAVGTTTCRVLETISRPRNPGPSAMSESSPGPMLQSGPGLSGWTDLFIYPPYKFNIVDMLLTNFHLPKTTLLMLVSAFCGRELLLKAYHEAIRERYRFYSYGDCMLIL